MFPALIFARNIEIDTNIKYQEIEGFGASDAWSTEVLKTFPESKRNTAARWLFNSELKSDKSANGIGLSIWRFALGPFGNMPAGSSNIPADYIDETCNYVWDVNPGKQMFLDHALSYGCDQIGAWSACILPQLRPEGLNNTAFRKYAEFLADILNHYNENGINFNYIAPVYEPQYTWVEDVKWTTEKISEMTRILCETLIEKGNNTPVMLGECADWTNLYDKNDTNWHWARNQADAYFDPQSKNYIGSQDNLMQEMGVHSYWTDQDSTRIVSMRNKAKEAADKRGLKLHQTAWSYLSSGSIEGLPDTNLSDTDIALFTSKIIHSDLYYAGVSSWCYWEAFGVGDESHFHLIKTDETNKNIKARKNLWALGNYSLFIRPGYSRVHMTEASSLRSLMGTSYISPDNKTLVSVYTNMSYETFRFSPEIKLTTDTYIQNIRKYVTNSLYDLQKIPADISGEVVIPARSIVTYVYDIEEKDISLDVEENKTNESINVNYDRNFPEEIYVTSLGRSVLEIYGVNGIMYGKVMFENEHKFILPSNHNKFFIVKVSNDHESYKTYIVR